MKNLTTLIFLCLGFLCHASPTSKDTIYTNVESLMKEVESTNKKTATYYLVLKDTKDKDVKVRIDLKQIDADIPIYQSDELDIKKLLALKEESIEEPMEKFKEFSVKLEDWKTVNKEVKVFKAQIKSLKTGDSLTWDMQSIDSIQKIIDQRVIVLANNDKAYNEAFNEYEKMINDVLGNLKDKYTERLSSAIEEAYQKLENAETVFLTAQDTPTWHDVRINLIKLDARRPMKVSYIARSAKKVTENITAGKFYYILHFAEFGLYFPTKVQDIIDDIKQKEVKLNPYLPAERFALVCDDQYRTQHYINSVVDYKNYKGELDATPREIKIIVDRYYEDDKQTFSRIDYDNDGINDGFVIERDGKPSSLEIVSGKNKRIRAGTYHFEINPYAGSKKTKKYVNKTLRLSNVPGRSGILFHWGRKYTWSAGCLLGLPKLKIPKTNGNSCETEESIQFVDEVLNYVRKTEELIKSEYKLEMVKKTIIIKQNKF
jgi:hypothetical protein